MYCWKSSLQGLIEGEGGEGTQNMRKECLQNKKSGNSFEVSDNLFNFVGDYINLCRNMSNKELGYVYILTNPNFREDWVKVAE